MSVGFLVVGVIPFAVGVTITALLFRRLAKGSRGRKIFVGVCVLLFGISLAFILNDNDINRFLTRHLGFTYFAYYQDLVKVIIASLFSGTLGVFAFLFVRFVPSNQSSGGSSSTSGSTWDWPSSSNDSSRGGGGGGFFGSSGGDRGGGGGGRF
ncbi:MAG: hypothetical protein LBM23_02125 [Propionibacteriaceae bacterium]|jgi:hypothetical protein|nr:hypothetical protein [Propionibacteriaceae bacterium]